MAGVTAEVKGGWSALKSHWLFFLIAIFLIVGMAFKYDNANQGKVRTWIAGLPLVGPFFFPKTGA